MPELFDKRGGFRKLHTFTLASTGAKQMGRWVLFFLCMGLIFVAIIGPGALLFLGGSLLAIALIVALPGAWIYAEFRYKPWLRILLGVLTLTLYVFGFSCAHALGLRFTYNAHYGEATDNLIKTAIEQIEDGNLDRVLQVWRGLDFQYRPTYENRARYQELAEEAVRIMKGEPIEPESPWDVSMFNESNWHGHWEGDGAFWLFIDYGHPFIIVYHWYSLDEPKSISISPDYAVLTFKIHGTVSHRITLRNRYEALHEWFDTEKNQALGTQTLYKLIRVPGKGIEAP